MSTKQALTAEQVLVAMIRDPNKKFTAGRRTTSFENHGVAVVYGHNNAYIHCTVLGFLNTFHDVAWTEHKEPRVVEFEFELSFDDSGCCINFFLKDHHLPTLVRKAVGGDSAAANMTVKIKCTATGPSMCKRSDLCSDNKDAVAH